MATNSNSGRTRRIGKGSLTKYKTKSGVRWRWQAYAPINPNNPAFGVKRVGSSGYRTAAEADIALREALAKIKEHKKVVSSGGIPTVEEFGKKWLAGLMLAPATLNGYDVIFRNHVVPNIGSQKINQVTSTDLAIIYKQMSASGRKDVINPGGKLSPNTVNKIHIQIGSIFQAAVDEGLIGSNPARMRRIVKAPTSTQIRASKGEIEVWDIDQLKQFLDWNRDVYDDVLYELWCVMAFTGMRRGEAVALKWKDVDFATKVISIRRAADPVLIRQTKLTKTGKSRPVLIHDGLLELLKTLKAKRGEVHPSFVEPEAFVFGLPNGSLRSPNDISARWARAVMKAVAYMNEQNSLSNPVLPKLTLKGLRHSHATMLMKNGTNPKIVQERLGHSNINTTMDIYSHVTTTMQEEAVSNLVETWEETKTILAIDAEK